VTTRETERISDQLRRALPGGAWHGPSLEDILDGVAPEEAAARPIPAAHSIWEIALHRAAWGEIVRRRISGESGTDVPPEQDWPAGAEISEAAWQRTAERFVRAHEELAKVIAKLPDARLHETVPGHDDTLYGMLHGLVQRLLYHTGQMAILTKATRREPRH
jgi:uncharacterized damage-inducible protein DinB